MQKMEKAYEARVTDEEASRLLITFANRAYLWTNNEDSVQAETLMSNRKMLLVKAYTEGFAFIVDASLYESQTFWSLAFCGLEKYRFTESEVAWEESFFDKTDEDTELIGDTSPTSFHDGTYIEPDYGDICRRMGVTPVDIEAEKAEELKALQPLVDDGAISKYDAECVALAVLNRIDRDDLEDYELRAARIDAIVDRKKWDILNEFRWSVEDKFRTPSSAETAPGRSNERDAKKQPRRRKDK